MGWIYAVGAVALGGYFLYMAWDLLRHPSKAQARKTFFYSIWYLAGLFAVMVADSLILS
jgi:protoheme IX farnesyltransferase